MNANCARVLLQPGYVLHRRAFRDSSLLVELFTPQYGRVGVIARAARQSTSRLSGVLQPFRALQYLHCVCVLAYQQLDLNLFQISR